MIAKAAGLWSTAAGSGNHVPSFRQRLSGHAGHRIAVDHGPGCAESRKVDSPPLRGWKNYFGHRHARKMLCRAIVDRPGQISGKREVCRWLCHIGRRFSAGCCDSSKSDFEMQAICGAQTVRVPHIGSIGGEPKSRCRECVPGRACRGLGKILRKVPEGPLTVARQFTGESLTRRDTRAVGTPETILDRADAISAVPTGRKSILSATRH